MAIRLVSKDSKGLESNFDYQSESKLQFVIYKSEIEGTWIDLSQRFSNLGLNIKVIRTSIASLELLKQRIVLAIFWGASPEANANSHR